MGRYPWRQLNSCVIQILKYYGVNERQSAIVADSYITADACGLHSHGLAVLPAHIARIERGAYELKSEPKIIKETPSFAVLDGQNTIGPVSAKYCMEYAVEACKTSGIYHVFARNSNTFGPAFYYTKLATNNKLIGLCFSNSPPAMPAWGGKKKILGTNPLAIGIPGYRLGPILLDMATSVVATSKIKEACKHNVPIPEGWALDNDGNSTTNPVEALKGMVLPMAQYKGYGIALAIDILAGLTSGAAYLDQVGKFYSDDKSCMNVGQLFVTMDPLKIESEEFFSHIDDYIDQIHKSGNNEQEIFFPGEQKLRNLASSNIFGVELEDDIVANLNQLIKKCMIAESLAQI